MTDKPIIFSAPMVRALLDGRKTQTRRVLKPQPVIYPSLAPSFSWGKFGGMWPDDWFGYGNEIDGALRYAPGDRLWVREAFSYETLDVDRNGFMPPWYWADGNPASGDFTRPKPSIHMPRWASRLTLAVTDVRVQRLQEISEADAVAEGIEPYAGIDPDCTGFKDYSAAARAGWWLGPRESFRSLWNSIHGRDAWGVNPWVCALTFTVRRGNIDTLVGRARE